MASGPVFAMVWEGRDVVKTGRTILGATNPLASAPGTIRGDFAIVRHLCCVVTPEPLLTDLDRTSAATSATAATASRVHRRKLLSGSRRKIFRSGSPPTSTGCMRSHRHTKRYEESPTYMSCMTMN